jgi:hypothetical protein
MQIRERISFTSLLIRLAKRRLMITAIDRVGGIGPQVPGSEQYEGKFSSIYENTKDVYPPIQQFTSEFIP